MPRGVHGVRIVKAYQVDDEKGSLFIDINVAMRAARRAEFVRRISAWVEKVSVFQSISKESLVKMMTSDAGAATLNDAFKYYNGNSAGVQRLKRKVKRKTK